MTNQAKVESTLFTDDPPSELLDWILIGDESEKREAAKCLLLTYKDELFFRMKRAFPDCDDSMIADFVMLTFRKVIKNPEKFKRVTQEDPLKQKNRFRKWIFTIATRIYYSEIRKGSSLFQTQDENFWVKQSETLREPEPLPESSVIEDVELAINELSERDAAILRAYLYFRPDIDNSQAKMPRKVLNELCETFETTKPNIRTIIMRAKAKVRSLLEMKGITYGPQ